MQNNETKNTIRFFFENSVSKRTIYLFSRWFRLNDETTEEKDEVMSDIWINSPSTITEQTIEDLARIKNSPSFNENLGETKQLFFKRILIYAASIAFIIAVSVSFSYYILLPKPLEYTQLSVSYGESKKLTLSDGTIVAVNAGSTLIYPKNFTANTRTVFLSGEANFQVAKNKHKPFIVKTKHIDVKALGTKFTIQCYPNDKTTKATLVEGSVQVNTEQNYDKSYLLKPNNQLVYSTLDNTVSIIDVDAQKLATWEDGYLIFQGASFDDIAQTIERKYNVVINYDAGKLNQQSYYVKFNPDESLKDVMEILTILINKSSYKINNSTVYFYTK